MENLYFAQTCRRYEMTKEAYIAQAVAEAREKAEAFMQLYEDLRRDAK